MDAVRNAVNDLTLPELYAELSKTGCLLHHADFRRRSSCAGVRRGRGDAKEQ